MVLSDSQIKEKLSALTGWELVSGQIQKTYSLKDFQAAMKLVNQVAMIAENANHHPDIHINYKRVTLVYSTHSEGGLTEKDFAGAAMADRIAA